MVEALLRIPVEGRRLGYTGRLAGDLAPDSNHFALKVDSGGLYVNGGDPASGSVFGYNAQLKRMLGTLAKAVLKAA